MYNLISKLYLKLNLYFLSVESEPQRGLNIKMISKTEVENYLEYLISIYNKGLINKRIEDGYSLFSVFEENIPVSFAWSKTNNEHYIGEINKTLFFKEKINCIIDCVTIKEYRGKGYYSGLINYIVANSDSASLIYANDKNIASNKGIIKAGFKKEAAIFRILRVVFLKTNPNYDFKVL